MASADLRGPEGPRIEKIKSREAILKKSSLQYGMKVSIENEIFILGPSLAAEKQGLGSKCSIENEIFKPRMKISSENENFVRGGVFFLSSENDFFRSPGPLGAFQDVGRAKGEGPTVTEPNLRFPAVFCENLRFSAKLGRCERVLHFMGREVQGRQNFRTQAVKWVVAKLQGDKADSFFGKMSGREVTG